MNVKGNLNSLGSRIAKGVKIKTGPDLLPRIEIPSQFYNSNGLGLSNYLLIRKLLCINYKLRI